MRLDVMNSISVTNVAVGPGLAVARRKQCPNAVPYCRLLIVADFANAVADNISVRCEAASTIRIQCASCQIR